MNFYRSYTCRFPGVACYLNCGGCTLGAPCDVYVPRWGHNALEEASQVGFGFKSRRFPYCLIHGIINVQNFKLLRGGDEKMQIFVRALILEVVVPVYADRGLSGRDHRCVVVVGVAASSCSNRTRIHVS